MTNIADYPQLATKLLEVLADKKELKPISYVYTYFSRMVPCAETKFLETLIFLGKEGVIDLVAPKEGEDTLVIINETGELVVRLINR